MTDTPKQKSSGKGRNELIRYLHYLLSTGKYRTFGYWKESGEPNPFLKDVPRLDHATRSEIAYLIQTRKKTQH